MILSVKVYQKKFGSDLFELSRSSKAQMTYDKTSPE